MMKESKRTLKKKKKNLQLGHAPPENDRNSDLKKKGRLIEEEKRRRNSITIRIQFVF
jgi:hypothetical protein